MILVTGATGMVGSYLIMQLAKQNKQVVALYRNEDKIKNTKQLFEKNNCANLFQSIIWKKADILDIPSLEGVFNNIETVIHCAAFISFFPKDKHKLYKTNVEGTANMVNCSLAFKTKKFIYISSIAALGSEINDDKVITEESLWNNETPHSDYAISKKKGEMEVYRGQQEGLQIGILNPGVIFGKHFPHNESVFFENLLSLKIVPYTSCTIAVVSVHDVVNAVDFCLQKNSNDQFILVSENLPMQTLLQLFEKKKHKSATYFEIKRWQFRIVQIFDFLFSLLPFIKRKISKTSYKTAFSKTIISGNRITQNGFQYVDFEKSL